MVRRTIRECSSPQQVAASLAASANAQPSTAGSCQ
jgi:hypothetical protein